MLGNISKSKGFKGDKGDPFTFDDLTEEQIDKLRKGLVKEEELNESLENYPTKVEVQTMFDEFDGSVNTDEVIEIVEAEHIKHRTHYTEEILICDFVFSDSHEDEDLTVNLPQTIDLNKLRAYLNGKSVDVAYSENSEGAFDVQLLDTETGEELVWLNYSHITWPDIPQPNIYFQPFNEVGDNVKLYEENVVTLGEKYLPESVPTMINYDDVLLCEYTYKEEDFATDIRPTIPLRRIPNKDKIKFYVGEDQIPVQIEKGRYGDFYGRLYIDTMSFACFKYLAEENSIVFYNKYQDNPIFEYGAVAQIREDGVLSLEDKNIPESIARKEDVEKIVNEMLGIYAPTRSFINILGGIDNWVSEEVEDNEGNVIGSRYGQVVNVNNAVITPNSKVDLQISSEQMVVFYEKDIAFVAENENGVVTIYCIGNVPENDYTLQATVTEVGTNA